ncbi:MAG: hypothetical protein Q8R15_03845, partial [Candidatus Micrarchaeota archaeon]|nr:hypothetical protein [Candidatus Micrarchaeota archaeon]
MLYQKIIFSLFILIASSYLVSADVDTACNDYCSNSVFYTRGDFHEASQQCAYLTIQCSQGCDPETNRCRPEPPRTCDSYCDDGVYRYNGTLVRGLCRYSSATCEYGCNVEASACAPSTSTGAAPNNSAASNATSNYSTSQNSNYSNYSTSQATQVTRATNVNQNASLNTTAIVTEYPETTEESEEVENVDESDEQAQRTAGSVEGRVIPNACTAGCLDQNNCVPIGVRTPGKYCAVDRELKEQVGSGLVCSNHYECQSNICVDGTCSPVGLFQKVINFFNLLLQLFGIGDAVENTGQAIDNVNNNVVPPVGGQEVPAQQSSFNVEDNTVELAIDGMASFDAVIISGPALQIERVAGFGLGVRDDNPGRTTPYSLVFEYEGP